MNFRIKLLQIGLRILSKYMVTNGAPVIIKNSRGQILLGKRNSKALYYQGFWGLPGGVIDYGESAGDAAKREIKEELGVDSRFIRYGKTFMQMPTKECPMQTVTIPVYCEIKKGTPKPKDETSEVRWFSPKEIRKMELAYTHKKLLKQEEII